MNRPTPYGTFCQLLYALESARNQLAVAMAMEAKRTTPEKWRRYAQTGQRVLCCLRQLRGGSIPVSPRCFRALDILRAPCAGREDQTEAGRLCEHLGRVLEVLEDETEPPRTEASAGANS